MIGARTTDGHWSGATPRAGLFAVPVCPHMLIQRHMSSASTLTQDFTSDPKQRTLMHNEGVAL